MKLAWLVAVALPSCGGSGDTPSRPGEARFELEQVARVITRYHADKGKLPEGNAPFSNELCCPDYCKPDPRWWAHGPWKEMGFSMEHLSATALKYESARGTVTVTALRCNARPLTLTATLEGTRVVTTIE